MKKIAYILTLLSMVTSSYATESAHDSMENSEKAQAHPTKGFSEFEECAAVLMWLTRGSSINAGNPPNRTVKVPQGWVVVNTDASAKGPVMFICR